MRKLLQGGHVNVSRAFADTSAERVILQGALHVDTARSCRKAGIHACLGRHGEHLAILGLNAAASKQEIKQAYRKLALKYHPDVCKGDHCALIFKQVNNAYEVALGAEEEQESRVGDEGLDGFMGATDDSWEDWEEWMGWEGAGITDYSSHINPSYSF